MCIYACDRCGSSSCVLIARDYKDDKGPKSYKQPIRLKSINLVNNFDLTEVHSLFDTVYKHYTSKVSTTLLTQILPCSLSILVVKCVIPFMVFYVVNSTKRIKLCLSVII